jgi:membrane protease YdiL (CAAX protease family)
MSPPPRPSLATLPVVAAVWATLLTVAVLIGNRIVIRALADQEWPIAAYILLSATIAYGPLVLAVVWICRRWGSGSLRDDLGFSFRPVDLGWGPLTWLAALVAQVTMGLIVLAARIPIASNTEGVGAGRDDEGYVIALLIMAVIAAPFVEELVFRGVVMRGLSSRLSIPLAVGLQAVAFGVVHADPSYGWGNVGLVLVLSSVGAVLGGAAILVRRLAPSMIAHAIINAVALTLVLTGVLDQFER